MKRTLWLTTAAVALAGVNSIPLLAQPPQGRGVGRGAGMGMGPGPGGPGGGRGGPMGALRGVDLTEAQQEQIKPIHEEARGSEPPQAKLVDLQKQLQLAIFADSADAQKIEELKSAIGGAEVAALARRIELETRVAQVLTPEQRAKVRESLERSGPPRDRPGRGGRGVR